MGLVLIVICIALWLVFTPARVTPIVNKYADRFLECQTDIGRIELTLFKSFPNFKLRATDVTLVNPVEGAPCDTLLNVGVVEAGVDIKALLKRDELIVSGLTLRDGRVCAYVAADGKANFDIVSSDSETADEESEGGGFATIDLGKVVLKNVDVTYVDDESRTTARLNKVSATAEGVMKGDDIDAVLSLEPMSLAFAMDDDESPVKADLSGLAAKVKFSMKGDDVKADADMRPFRITLDYGVERYLNDAELGLRLTAGANTDKKNANIELLRITLDKLALSLMGTAASDNETGAINTDLRYDLETIGLNDIIALIPASFSSYLEGINITAGSLASSGTVKGEYRDSTSMPMIDAGLKLDGVALTYDALPFPLHGINGDLTVHTDLSDEASYAEISSFSARTPRSSLGTAGKVDKIFSDIRVDLDTKLDLNLAEFQSMVPDSMQLAMKGRAAGSVKTKLSLTQLENMELERMIVDGALALDGLDVVYDDMTLAADRSEVKLSLPNKRKDARDTGFAAVSLTAGDMRARMGTDIDARLLGASLSLESSDFREEGMIPAMSCNFSFDRLTAAVDTISVDIKTPSGRVSVSPQRRNAGQPRFSVQLRSGDLAASMGADSYAVEKLDMKGTVVYDKDQQEFFLKWTPRGSLDMQGADIDMKSMTYKIAVPAIKMEFNPREFNIEKANVTIDDSDFSLSGNIRNIYPYFRGDSILRGELKFVSGYADINKLMELTSAEEFSEDAPASQPADPGRQGSSAQAQTTAVAPVAVPVLIAAGQQSAAAGEQQDSTEAEEEAPMPLFIVPKDVDVLLHADIREARFGRGVMTDVNGDIHVRDGSLVLDQLSFASPGDMMLTAIYRTPRRNHLYLGLDFQLLNIEIEQLLDFIPPLEEVMPMLRSFTGTGEFHFAAETNLDSLYNLKMSTLRGAASIQGHDLALVMDLGMGKSFDRITKMLKLNLTDPKIDSLSAEFTIFRNEVDVYPFLLAMDNYKAVIAGRHNLDGSLSYNVSLVQSPLPFRASVNITGTMDDMHFKLGKAKYPDVYRPANRKAVQSEQLNLRRMIYEALSSKFARKEDDDPAAGE